MQVPALAHRSGHRRKPVFPGDQGRWQLDIQIILGKTVFRSHFDDVTKPFCRDKGSARPAPLDQGVGCQSRAVYDQINLAYRNICLVQNDGNTIKNGLFRCGVIRKNLGRMHFSAHIQNDIGKGAADICTKPDFLTIGHGQSLALRAASLI